MDKLALFIKSDQTKNWIALSVFGLGITHVMVDSYKGITIKYPGPQHE